MSKSVTICFETSSTVRDSLEREAAAQNVEVGILINQVVDQYLNGPQLINRRAHGRIDVDMSAVARPIDGEVGTAILPGKILDLSEGGLKLQCQCDVKDIDKLVAVGGQVEIIFTAPDKEYPICFTCEVRHIFRKGDSALGCEFLDPDGTNVETLKAIISSALN